MTTEHYNPQEPPKICPQCQKKGAKKRVKHFYINLDEEVRRMNKYFKEMKFEYFHLNRAFTCVRISAVPGHSM